jgi:hypothetical protein
MTHRMIAAATLALATVSTHSASVDAQEPSADQQIANATSPLPDNLNAGATVLGYRGGELVTLREGSNVMICLADNPAQEGFHAACYHKDLEPFMARGRELRAAGHEAPAIEAARLAEIEAGTLAMPVEPRALYSLSSRQEFDSATGIAPDTRGLYVIYMPYATEESTGISAKPAGDRPWLMYPGKPWAHVMISR